MKKIALHWLILIALVLGVVLGLNLGENTKYVVWMGDVFLRALKMIIVPLVFTSIISGITGIGNVSDLGKMGFKTLTYYLSTSLLAIVTGLFFVNLIKPGVNADLGFVKEVDGLNVAADSFGSTLINIIPTNIFSSFAAAEMLSIIFFAILAGFFINKLDDKNRIMLTDLANGGFDLMMKITGFIIAFTPLGVLGIVTGTVAQQASDTTALIAISQRLGLYMICVIAGLGVHAFITLPLLLKFFGNINPLKHFKAMTTPLLTAFSTSSSSATLPLTIKAVEEESGVSNKVSSFVLPLGATVNMDGTALYECAAAMFIAQAYGIDLSAGQQVIVVITALLASIGAAGIPMAGLVMISVVLTAVGLPLEGVGLILAVDRILDMFRTTVNVWSDTCGSVIIAKTQGETLKYNQN